MKTEKKQFWSFKTQNLWYLVTSWVRKLGCWKSREGERQ